MGETDPTAGVDAARATPDASAAEGTPGDRGAPTAAGGVALPPLDFAALPPVSEGPRLATAWWLAWGHLRAGQEGFLSLVTVINIAAVVIGVAMVNTVVAVMAGFEDDLRDKILGANAHIVVTAYGGQGFEDPDALCAKVADVEGVAGVAPFVYGELLVRSALASSGAVVKGVDPVRTADVTSLRDSLVLGLQGEVTTHDARTAAMAALGEPVPARTDDDTPLPGLFIGVDMAETLGVLPGDDVQLVNPFGVGGGSLLGVPTPRVKRFRVAGLFRTGMFEYDSKWVHPVNSELTAFFGLPDGEVHGLEVRVHDPDAVRALSAGIEDALGYPYFARHWRELNQALFEALALEKVVMGLILFIVVLVAGMLVITNVYTLVRSKQREIAVLRAMGASAGLVMQVFLLVGSSIGGVGTVLGTALGLGLCAFLDWYQFPFDTDVYMLSSLPVVVKPTDVLTVAVATVSVCFLASVYPAMRAARLDPVAGLRAE